jgi:hypothetical protein
VGAAQRVLQLHLLPPRRPRRRHRRADHRAGRGPRRLAGRLPGKLMVATHVELRQVAEISPRA